MEEKSKSSGKIYYIIIIIILMALNGLFIYNYFNTDKKLVQTEETLFATDSAKAELEKILNETQDNLNLYKGKNSQLDAYLKEKNDSLQEYADRIESLLRKGKLSKNQLEKAMEEIDQLRYYKRKYLNQIDSLSTKISILSRENSDLKGKVDQEKRQNENLTMENVKLNNKVAIGAKLNAKQIFVSGVKTRNNGKERETNRASQLEKLKISFTLDENYVNDPGEKTVYLKVIGPDGATLYNESSGSGTFKFQGQESLYSTKQDVQFEQKAQEIMLYWTKGSAFGKGEYKLELYADGFQIGASSFELK
jgi:regulator of replication initiation timing